MTGLTASMHEKFTHDMIAKLNAERVTTVLDFVIGKVEKIVQLTCLRYEDVMDIKQHLLNVFAGKSRTASSMYHWERVNVISTGIQCLDTLLNSGLHPGEIYEICGTTASGKTQLCITVAAKIAACDKALVHYVDTKRDFSAIRLEEILNELKYEKEAASEIMHRIKVSSVVNAAELFNLLNHMAKGKKILQNETTSKIIIIDSLPAVLFKHTDDHKTNYSLNKLSNLCRYIANQYSLPIILVNLLTQWNAPRNTDPSVHKDTRIIITRPALGKYWLHIPNTRLMIERLHGEYRRITVWKSLCLKTHNKCNIKVTNIGVISAT